MRILLMLLILWTGGASAHETSQERLRVVIVSERAGATDLHVRLPAPLLFAAEATARSSPSAAVEAPFLRVSHGHGAHHLDQAAVERDPVAFKARILATIAVTVDGQPSAASVLAFAVQHVASLPSFAIPAEARAAIRRPPAGTDLHVAEAYIDAEVTIEAVGSVVLTFPQDAIAFPGHVHFDNVFVDARADPPQTRVRMGALSEPVEMPRP